MKVDLGKMVPDYDGCCEEAAKEKPKKMKKSYPTFYVSDVNLKDVDSKIVGKEVTVTAKIRIKEISQRKTVRDGKEKDNDSMDVEVMSIDFGKAPKNFKSLQEAIEDGLSEE